MGLCDRCARLLDEFKTLLKTKTFTFVQKVKDAPKGISECCCLTNILVPRGNVKEFLRRRDIRNAHERLPHLDPALGHIHTAFLETCGLLLQSEDLDVQREVSLSLLDLLTGDMIQEEHVLEMGVLEYLVDLLQSGDRTVQCSTSACIALLASSDFNREVIVSSDCVLPLLVLARSFDPTVQKNAVRAIFNLTISASTLGALCEEGVVPVLTLLLQSADSEVQFYSCSALSNIATAPKQHARMLQLGDCFLLKSLLSLMGSSVQKNSTQACQCLRRLTKDVSWEVWGSLVSVPGAWGPGALALLCTLAPGQAQQQLMGLDWPSPLLMLLRAPELSSVQAALMLLSQVAAHPFHITSLANHSIMYTLGDLLLTHPSSPTVVTHCAIALRHLWAVAENLQAVLATQCLPGLLLALELEWKEDETLLSIMSSLQSLVCYDSFRSHFKEKLTAIHVVRLVRFSGQMENLELSFAAGSVISKLDMNDHMLKPHHRAIVAYLIRFLRNQEVRFQQLAITSVCNLNEGGDLRGMMGGLELERELQRVQQQTERTTQLLQTLLKD